MTLLNGFGISLPEIEVIAAGKGRIIKPEHRIIGFVCKGTLQFVSQLGCGKAYQKTGKGNSFFTNMTTALVYLQESKAH